ncbi:ABC transporter permease [Kineosporia mesophila]|uniref:ABC transporter permease n=1 Tax=Kineosporia mesophila TaxID=566012 RepID=A0ABP7AQE8_9ACTN|nr:ABC transporter permease subunit [Kineosporia mesophila]MCD5349216.1 ABC transporter permease subunit [Kineosporia mesophila]
MSRALGKALAPLLVSAVVAVVAWELFLRAFDVNPLIGKDPAAVWEYLFTAPEAAANRTSVIDPLLVTLKDGALGFAGGMIAAVLVAVTFVLFRSVEQAFLPVAMLLRSVPLVAMTPLVTLVFGRGLTGVCVIAGIVVFFPALVTIVFGLRSVNPLAQDLVAAYGGSSFTALRKVAFPSALPSLFAAMRISVPGALIGALVAEWLATGKGVGGEILRDIGAFGYDHLWASIIVLTAVSVVLYTVLGLIEQVVLARFSD